MLIYKGTNMGNSHRHAHEKVPVILVGGVDGTFRGNRHIVYPDNVERCSNMLLGVLELYDIEPVELYGPELSELYGLKRGVLGDSTGRLSIA